MSPENTPAAVVKLAEYREKGRRDQFENFITDNLGREINRRGAVLKIYPAALLTSMIMPAGRNESGFSEIISRKYFAVNDKEQARFEESAKAGWIRTKDGLILPDIVEISDSDGESSIDFYPNSSMQGANYDNSFKTKRRNKRGFVEGLYDTNGDLQQADIVIGTVGAIRAEEDGAIIYDNRPNYSITRKYQEPAVKSKGLFTTDAKLAKEVIFSHTISDDNMLQITGILADTRSDFIQIPAKLSRDGMLEKLFSKELLADLLSASPNLDASWRTNVQDLTGISWIIGSLDTGK